MLVETRLRTQSTPIGSGWPELMDLNSALCVWPGSIGAQCPPVLVLERSGLPTLQSTRSQFHRFRRALPLEISGAQSWRVRSRSKRVTGRRDPLEGAEGPHFDSLGNRCGAAGATTPLGLLGSPSFGVDESLAGRYHVRSPDRPGGTGRNIPTGSTAPASASPWPLSVQRPARAGRVCRCSRSTRRSRFDQTNPEGGCLQFHSGW